jgi:hypothetical protein
MPNILKKFITIGKTLFQFKKISREYIAGGIFGAFLVLFIGVLAIDVSIFIKNVIVSETPVQTPKPMLVSERDIDEIIALLDARHAAYENLLVPLPPQPKEQENKGLNNKHRSF